MSDNKYNFSFIIPHKNIPDLLVRCVSSIPRRSDVQIIVVDDNSDNEKVDFENFPFLEDPRVEIFFDKTGKGAGHARNVGLEHAQGKWIVFSDADDYFLYSINNAMDEYVDSLYDIVYFLTQNVDTNTYIPSTSPRGCNNYVTEYQARRKNSEINLRINYHTPWGKFYKSSLISKYNIKFDEVFRANDVHFGYLVGYYASTIFADNRAIYCLTNRSDSLSTIYSPETCIMISDVYCTCIDFLKANRLYGTGVYWHTYKGVINMLVLLKVADKNKYNETFEMLKTRGFSKIRIQKDVLWFSIKSIIRHFL